MKKWIVVISAVLLVGLIFLSCSSDKSTGPDSDSTDPTVNITYPANNAEFLEGTQIIIKADATDNKGVTKAELYINGDIADTVTAAPYEFTWDTTGKAGIHTIMAKAYDAGGNIGTSGVVSVKINSGQFITISTPNGGESWQTGTTHTIIWTDNIAENVKIELYKGASLADIISNTASGNSYSWTIPSTITTGADYKVKITSITNSAINDYSDANFSISGTITVVTPNGGESWQLGSTQNITWTDNISENVKIELYKGSTLAEVISSNTSGNNFSWTIPSTLVVATDYKIKISSTTTPSIYDESNANFAVALASNLTVISPNGGESWQMGIAHSITWTDNVSENVKIDLYKGTILNSIIASSVASIGTYSWTIPITLVSGTDYKIRITGVTSTTLYDESNASFTITTVPEGMIFVQGGSFNMGDQFGDGDSNELPLHSVSITSFNIGKYEVTQSEWAAYMPVGTYNYGSGAYYPVYYVTWYASIKYCNLRSMAEGLTPCYTISNSTDPAVWGTVPTSSNATWDAVICNWSANGYRLPSEAEWEYAARGGIHYDDNYHYSGSDVLDDVAWYYSNSGNTSHSVGTKLPNQLGIYDMSGNLWEWCWDWYDSYTSIAQADPTGPSTGSNRVGRGGLWGYSDFRCRVAFRGNYYPHYNTYGIGFRLSRTP